MHILITGSCGFIGFHLSKSLLDQGHKILGIDNLNDYYDTRLKKNRLSILEKSKNFTFKEIDLIDYRDLKECSKTFSPNIIVNLAAQAGVRTTLLDPLSYMESNISAFVNILKLTEELNINRLIYASSSSVYSGSKNYPFKEDLENLSPLNLYGKSKLINENLADFYSKARSISLVGLRFFTVYGPYGRPDMAYYKFAYSLLNDQEITIFNKGNMKRDMTYISDIIYGINKVISSEELKDSNIIFNLGGNRPISTMDLLRYLENSMNKKGKIIYENSELETDITHSDNSKAMKYLNYKPKVSFEEGMEKFIDWFSKHHIK